MYSLELIEHLLESDSLVETTFRDAMIPHLPPGLAKLLDVQSYAVNSIFYAYQN